jgi:hypothetical protein
MAMGPRSFRSAPISQISQYLPYLFTNPNTQLDILRDQGPEFRFWLKQLPLDWHSGQPFLTPSFRWSTKEKGVVSAVWQVSSFRFTGDAKHWDKSGGLVASNGLKKVPAPGGYEQFRIDFTAFAPAPPSANAPARGRAVRVATRASLAAHAQPAFVRRPSTPATRAQAKAMLQKLSATTLARLPAFRRTYYVRVVPLNAHGECVGLPSEAVEVTYGEPPPQPVIHLMTPAEIAAAEAARKAKLPKLNHPVVRVASYQPIQEEAPSHMYHYVVIRELGPMLAAAGWKVGAKLDFTPHQEDQSWWDQIGDFFSDAVSFVADAVNWVAKAYDSIKAAAVSWAPDWAQGPLTAAMDVGLAAIGVPPTLPNFDEVASMGTDYLVKQAADAAGVPPDVASEAVNAVLDGAKAAENGGGGDPSVWLKPDPDFLYRPAYVLLTVSNPSDQPTERVCIAVRVAVPDDADAQKYLEPLFAAEYVPMPPLQPGETLTVPVMLKEYTQLRQFDTDPFAGKQRFSLRYATAAANICVYTDAYVKQETQNPVVGQQGLRLEHAYAACRAP